MEVKMRTFSTIALASLALLVACGTDSVTVDNPGTAQGSDRIVGGSSYSGLPAVGALTVGGEMYCSATLIGPRKVLTAAHCLEGVAASEMRFVIGADVASPEYTLGVLSLKIHPSYDSTNITNDVGIVTLSKDAPIAPLGVNTHMDSSWVGTQLFFVGYGVTNGYSQTGAGKKRAVWMNVSQVNSTSFEYADTGKNTCNGDSGGPAFYKDPQGNYLVAGITSYGDNGCTQYGVDTRVDSFLSFIGDTGTGTGTGTGSTGGTTTDPCKGETFAGRCDGADVIWCENNAVQTQSCADSGKTCVFDAANAYYACGVATQAPSNDPCNGETFAGRCDLGTVIWCESGTVKSIDCTKSSASCGYDSSAGYYNCMS
jgi:secreted trypsin-like serine protease